MGISHYQFAGLAYNSRTREVSVHQHPTPHLLSKQCGQLLQQFLNAPDHTLTRDEIRQCLWGHNYVSEDTINHAVCRLRKSLAMLPQNCEVHIETLPATGYRLLGCEPEPQDTHTARYRRPAVLIASLLSLL